MILSHQQQQINNEGYFGLMVRMAYGIAKMEGYFIPNTLAAINNNPGNLRSWGTRPINRGFAQFPDPGSGWTALYSQINRNILRELSLNEFFAGKPGVYPGYAPAADNNRPQDYAKFVNKWLKVDLDRPILEMFWSNPGKFVL